MTFHFPMTFHNDFKLINRRYLLTTPFLSHTSFSMHDYVLFSIKLRVSLLSTEDIEKPLATNTKRQTFFRCLWINLLKSQLMLSLEPKREKNRPQQFINRCEAKRHKSLFIFICIYVICLMVIRAIFIFIRWCREKRVEAVSKQQRIH